MLALINCILSNIASILQWTWDSIFKSNLVANWLAQLSQIFDI